MKTNLLLVAAAGIVAGTIGCGSQGDQDQNGLPAPETLEQGLTILDAQDITFSAAYKKADRVIYLQALRGQPTPEAYQKNEGSPKYEVDARFDADNGRTFYTRRGGDEWIDATWADDFDRQESLPASRESNEVLFQMAAEAAAVMDTEVTLQLGAERAALATPALQAIRQFGETAPATFIDQKQRLIDHRLSEGLTAPEVEYGTPGPDGDPDEAFGANYYYMAVHDMTIYAFGKHSATRLYAWYGYWGAVHDACNHGDCASTMGQKCLLQYYEATSDYKPAWNLQHCATGYSAWSDDGGHNCHDDTRVQLANFVYGKNNNGYQAWCNDGDSDADISVDILFVELDQDGSPECNSSRGKGYNHPSWCQYNYSSGASCPATYQGTNDGCDCGCTFPDGTMADPDCAAR